MNRYFVRAAKYFLRIIVLFVILFGIMNLMGQSGVTLEMLPQFFASKETIIMLVVLLALILLHPIMGYVKRPFDVDLENDRDRVLNMFATYGYKLDSETDDYLVFRTIGSLNRLLLLNEDAIIIDKRALPTTIEGNRKSVVRVMFRLKP